MIEKLCRLLEVLDLDYLILQWDVSPEGQTYPSVIIYVSNNRFYLEEGSPTYPHQGNYREISLEEYLDRVIYHLEKEIREVETITDPIRDKANEVLKKLRYKINRLEMKQKLLAEEIDELYELLDTKLKSNGG